MARDTEAILRDTEETLNTAKFGLADLLGDDPRRCMSGLRNLVVFGRAVTSVLQNLRSAVGGPSLTSGICRTGRRCAPTNS